jgi:hypothetical protein
MGKNFAWMCREGSREVVGVQNSVALSPQANYTDWATATCRRNLAPTFADRGVSRGQVAPHILTRLSGPRSRPNITQKIW